VSIVDLLSLSVKPPFGGTERGGAPLFMSFLLMIIGMIYIHIMERGIKVEDPRFFELYEG